MYSAASSCGNRELLGQPVRAEAVHDPEVDRLRARALARPDLDRARASAPRPRSPRARPRRARRSPSARPRRRHGRGCAAPPASSRRRSGCAPSSAMKQLRIWRPSSVRIGMFCRFGSVLDRRPVVVAVWLKVVCRRPVASCDQRRQRVEVGALQLGQLSPPLDLLDDRVLVADRAQHARVGGEAGLAAPLARQLQLLEQDRAELLRGADRELLAGQLADLVLELVDLLGDARPRSRPAGRCRASRPARSSR